MKDDSELDKLFQEYRAACPEIEPSPDFMPAVWRRIEARQSFWYVFRHLGRPVTAGSAALCLLLLILNLISSSATHNLVPSYTDALMADHTAEKTYYAEAIRSVPPVEHAVPQPAR